MIVHLFYQAIIQLTRTVKTFGSAQIFVNVRLGDFMLANFLIFTIHLPPHRRFCPGGAPRDTVWFSCAKRVSEFDFWIGLRIEKFGMFPGTCVGIGLQFRYKHQIPWNPWQQKVAMACRQANGGWWFFKQRVEDMVEDGNRNGNQGRMGWESL